jgi:hypothetical protein
VVPNESEPDSVCNSGEPANEWRSRGQSHIHFLSQTSYKGEKWAVGDGWGGNAGKVSYGSIENCPGRKPRKRGRTEVRAAIVAKKRGNFRGAKGGRKVERQRP